MTLAAIVDAGIVGTLDVPIDIGTVRHSLGFNPNIAFTDGAGLNQAQQLFSDHRTIAASGTDDLDLNGVLKDAAGNLIALTKIKAILIRAAAGNANNVVVGGAPANQDFSMFGSATDKVQIKPGGFMMLCAPDANGYAVTPGTGDILRIANGGAGTSVDYDIVIIGA